MKQKLKTVALAWALTPYLAFATTFTEGLVVCCKFDGDLKDSSGQGNDLTALRGISYCAGHKGFDHSAVQISSNRLVCINNYVSSGDWYDAKYSFTNAWTFACWIKTDHATLLQNEETGDISGYYEAIQYLYFPGGGSAIAVGTNGVNVFEHHPYYMPASLRWEGNLNGWHHLVITIDGKDHGFKLYVDGRFVHEGLNTGLDKCIDVLGGLKSDMTDGVGLGGGYYGSSFCGALDDLYVYNRPLSAEEVRSLYDGYSWQYEVKDGMARIMGLQMIDQTTPIPSSIKIPSIIDDCFVTSIGDNAFADYTNLISVAIPASVTEIGSVAFSGCEKLADVWFEGNTIGKIGRHAFLGCYWDLIMHVPAGWQGRGRTIAGYTVWRGGSSDVEKSVNMTVTNVVVQYVLSSIRPEIAVPVSNSVGLVNIITEVASSGAVSVPTEWKDNYQQFETKFGTDFGKALAMKTGKKDGAGNDMFVWQDFVAGTDPTDENDQFTASITIVDGVPVISYTPELTAEQAALRVYKTYGKMKLTDTAWTDITAKTSEERANYNFFKVTVEMK